MGAFDPLTRLICFLAYAGFCVVGIAMIAAGIWYNSSIPGANEAVMFAMAGGGFGMLCVGGLALWAIFKQHPAFLWIVWLIDVGLFVVITLGAVIGIILGMDVRDPTREALDRSFGLPDWRESLWDGLYCQEHSSSTHCTTVFAQDAALALAATDANYTAGDTVRHLFGDCNYAMLGVPCAVSDAAGDVSVCDAVDMSDATQTDADRETACEAITDGMGCVFTPSGTETLASCDGDDDGTGDPAECTGTADIPTCDPSAVSGCPAGCDSTPDNTPVCAFADPVAFTGCPDGCTENLDTGAESCTGTATTIPGTCTGTATQPQCDANAVDRAGCAAGCTFTPAGAGDACELNGDSSGCAVQGGNCVYTPYEAPSPRTCTVKPDCRDRDAIYLSCTACATDCKEALISEVKSGMEPAAIVLIATFAFSVICVIINHYIVVNKPDGGIVVLLALVFNVLVTLLGLVVAVLAAYGQYLVVEECPSDSDCTNVAAIFAILLGMGLFVVGALGSIGTKFGISFFMTTVNFVHSILAFGLLITGVFVLIVSGHMETINAKSEHHFPELRDQFESQNKDFCANPADPEQSLSNADCRLKMREEIENNMMVFGSALAFVAIGFMVTMYFTWQAIKMLSDDDDGDEDGDE
jgi:hypothetical protein